MTRVVWLALYAATAASALTAQTPVDTTGAVASAGTQMDVLRRQVQQRWRAHVRTELDLTDDQAAKLQATEDRFAGQRREVAQRQQQVLQALHRQLQPGVAANTDSVRRLMDAREQNRTAMAELDRNEDRDIAGYLSPVQHARYQLMRQRLQERIAELRRQRRERILGPRGGVGGGPGGPGGGRGARRGPPR
jgi:Spy/CpxP family protein refolding chaperone